MRIGLAQLNSILGDVDENLDRAHNVVTDVVRDDSEGRRSYLLHFERSYGQYLFDALLDAGREFGIDVDGFVSPGI